MSTTVTHFGENKRLQFESSKENYYILSLQAIINAMFIHLKDTSERVTRRWDETSWQEASEFLCIETPPFLREFGNKKDRPKNQETLSPMRY